MSRYCILFLMLTGLWSCAAGPRHSFTQFHMNTEFEITVYSRLPGLQVQSRVQAAFNEVRRIEARYSSWTPGTRVYQLNQQKSLPLEEEDRLILQKCLEMAEISGGCFDVTVLPLMGAWGFRDKKYRIPSPAELQSALKRVNVRQNLVLGSEEARLLNDAMLDLGGILKGYAVDRAVQVLKEQGFSAGIVNAGGNLLAFGSKSPREPWIIGIRHPRRPQDLFAAYAIGPDTAFATSGDYERFFMLNGVRYHHIMDPISGHPVSNSIVSVTVIHPSAFMTDGLSTSLFVMGITKGLAFAEDQQLPVLFIYEQNGSLKYTNSSRWLASDMQLMP